ncbi:unnamed protein product [Brassica oleracea]
MKVPLLLGRSLGILNPSPAVGNTPQSHRFIVKVTIVHPQCNTVEIFKRHWQKLY